MDNGNRLIGIDGKKPMILVVDDTPSNLVVISTIVEDEGGEVRVARNGPTALRLAQLSPRPDLILLDIMMPDMDGHMVLAELRKNPLTRDIPVIFVTAMNDPEEEERGISEGAADFVTKPVKPAVLIARVRAQIELSRAQQLLSSQKSWLEKEVAPGRGEHAAGKPPATDPGGHRLRHLGMRPAHPAQSLERGPAPDLRLCRGAATIDDYLALVSPEDRPVVEGQLLAPSRHGAPGTLAEFRLRHQDGSWHWVEARSRSLEHDADGQPRLIVGTLLDISARKASEAERQLADLVFTGISDGICITDAQRNILRINKAFSHITGYEPADARAEPAPAPLGQSRPRFLPRHVGKARPLRQLAGRDQNRRKDGSLSKRMAVDFLRAQCRRDQPLRPVQRPSERQAAAERIQYLSSYDTLTGLPNRALFADLDQALLTARRFERGDGADPFDLDRFRCSTTRSARRSATRSWSKWVVACNCRCGKAIPSAG
jgi:CheY-like chemotaxis protein/PAS domain-containing protein